MKTLLKIMMAVAIASPLMAQGNPMSQEAQRVWNRTKSMIVAAASKMPEEHYSFKPAPESQSFGDLVAHTANAAMASCSGIGGERKRAGVNGSSSKADLVAAIDAAMAECDAAYGALTDSNATDMIAGRRGQSPASDCCIETPSTSSTSTRKWRCTCGSMGWCRLPAKAVRAFLPSGQAGPCRSGWTKRLSHEQARRRAFVSGF